MTDERRAARGPRGSEARRRTSAGLATGESSSDGDRLAELEARLAHLESMSGLRQRGRDLMGRVAPPEAGRHFRNAGREHLLGVRSIVDFWIRRIELDEDRVEVPATGRERIEIE